MSKPQDLESVFCENDFSQDDKNIHKRLQTTVQKYSLAIKTQGPLEVSPKAFLLDIGKTGFFKCTNALTYNRGLQIIEECDSGLRSLVSVHSSLGLFALKEYAKDLLKESYLEGTKHLCFGLTEPQGGSDPFSNETQIFERGQSLEITGTKCWVTGAATASAIVVWGKDQNGKTKGALVPMDTKGIQIDPMAKTHSLEAASSFQVTFKKCEVPGSHLFEAKGLGAPLNCLNNARLGVAWGVLGAAWNCFTETLEFCSARKLFGEALTKKQITHYKLSHLYSLILETQYFLRAITLEKQRSGSIDVHLVSMAKMRACEKACEVARECRDLLGGIGVTEDFSTPRHMRNLESVKTYEGTDTIHRLIIGSYLTGEKVF